MTAGRYAPAGVSFRACCFKIFFCTLPSDVRGKSDTKRTDPGTLKSASLPLHQSIMSFSLQHSPGLHDHERQHGLFAHRIRHAHHRDLLH